jgi:hypothetical protein
MKKKKCKFNHKFRRIKDTGKSRYDECERCGERRVLQEIEGHQPIDWDWLNGKKQEL